MEKLSGNQIREKFLQFYESKGHAIVPSSSLIPQNDPTLMFVNAGMVQFKNVFTGLEKRNYSRATSSQACVRAGGKHNDLENVGHTARHHTFFEMLGNFSFGDYFKEDAIKYAWEFLTKVIGLPKEKLTVTIYYTDDEAYSIWHNQIGVEDKNIIRIDTKDNFWSMGDTGPCGPCSEIFYDHGPSVWGGKPGSKDEDGDRYIEIWNLVFMQYDMQADGTMVPLPKTGIDTGMGLERLAAVLQNVHNNYDTDLFTPIIKKVASLLNIDIPTEKDGERNEVLASLRVAADHIRSVSFLILDGVMPSNEGRGYVLRRIIRRALRHLNMLGAKEPMFYKLVSALVDVMGSHYEDLAKAQIMIENTIKTEEEAFLKTLKHGMAILNEEIASLKSGDILQGSVAFKLYDTFGFPLDLTEDALRPHNIKVDIDAFNKSMEHQKEQSRAGKLGTGQEALADIWFKLAEKLPKTKFVGYDETETEAKILAIVDIEGNEVQKTDKNESYYLIFDKTPYYATSGGQESDTGYIKKGDKILDVKDVQNINGLYVHYCVINKNTKEESYFEKDETVKLELDILYRQDIARHHTATHLLHAALKDVLGSEVFQKGSKVDSKALRLDFSYNKALTKDDILNIENIVNKNIMANYIVKCEVLPKEEATARNGVQALFGEKYADTVRLLTVGGQYKPVSAELCGGTHVTCTGEIGLFKVVSDSASSAGVRRITAVAGTAAINYIIEEENVLTALSDALKTNSKELINKVNLLKQEITDLKAEVKKAKQSGGLSVHSLVADAKEIEGFKLVMKEVPDMEASDIRELADNLKNHIKSGIVVLISNGAEKASIVVGVTNNLTQKFNAGQIVNLAAQVLGGKGGGRADLAMAGAKKSDEKDIKNALDAVLQHIVATCC